MRVSSADFPAYAERVREICELGDYLSMPVHTYSSGMMMRLNFALSISIDPDILILDEWLSVADAKFRKKAEEMMTDLVSRSRILVIASHNVELLERVCNRGILLKAGVLAVEDNMEQTISAYTQGESTPQHLFAR
jgi:lipopolysaccharide transport system ATP-binding protein